MPVVLQLNSDQTMTLIKDGGLRVELTDDQAIDVTAQIGQLLKSKDHYATGKPPVYKVRKKYKSRVLRRVTHVHGQQTVSSKVYAKIEELTGGTQVTYQEVLRLLGIDRKHDSSVYMALARLVKLRKIKRIERGVYTVL